MRKLWEVRKILSIHGGKGPDRCYVCGRWMGPPFDFHEPDCPVSWLMKRLNGEKEQEINE